MNINLIRERARFVNVESAHTTIPCANRYNLYWSVLVNRETPEFEVWRVLVVIHSVVGRTRSNERL